VSDSNAPSASKVPDPRIVPDDAAGRERAIGVLRAGGVVALPTDTVYGIGVALETPGGIERLFAAKRRPPEKGIALLLADADQARGLGRFGRAADALAAAFWPGGLTLVVPIARGVELPSVLTGGAPTIGLRVPAHPAPRALAHALGPLPTTSANVSGQPELPDAEAVLEQLGDGIDLVLDGGPAHGGPASTVVLAEDEASRILRRGAIDPRVVSEVLSRAGLPGATLPDPTPE
jgi:L-threonylcarbamoyladenylate synthase